MFEPGLDPDLSNRIIKWLDAAMYLAILQICALVIKIIFSCITRSVYHIQYIIYIISKHMCDLIINQYISNIISKRRGENISAWMNKSSLC